MFEIKAFGKQLLSFGRSVQTNLTGKQILEIFGGNETESGTPINESNAITYSAVYSAVRVYAESIAFLPLQIYQKTEEGRTQLTDHPLYYLLHDQPNNFQTAFTFRELMTTRQCLAGNGYAYIERDGLGNVIELIPFSLETRIKPVYDAKRRTIFYVIDDKDVIEQANILHIPALSLDGIEGKSPVKVAMESYGLSMSMQRFGARFFGKGANPDFILEHPGKLSPNAVANIKTGWSKDAAGMENSKTPRVLEEGMKVTKLSISPEESQFLESRKFQITEVARWFRLPAHMIQDLSNATFSNIEQQDIGFVKYSLAPYLKRWEQELNRKLLTEQEKKSGVFFEFNLDALLRGDTLTRASFYTQMIAARVLNPNEVRRRENMNDYEGGDKYENPNTTAPTPTNGAETTETEDTADSTDLTKKIKKVHMNGHTHIYNGA